MSLKPKIYVVFVKNHKLETYNFSTIELAKGFVRTLTTKEHVIILGNLITDGMKDI